MQAAKPRSDQRLDGHVALARLRQLSTEERLLVGLYYYENLSANDIAAVLERPAAAVEADLDAVFVKLAADPSQPEPVHQYARELLG